jgi:hypothetical protein
VGSLSTGKILLVRQLITDMLLVTTMATFLRRVRAESFETRFSPSCGCVMIFVMALVAEEAANNVVSGLQHFALAGKALEKVKFSSTGE